MGNLSMENPDKMWIRIENGVYTTPIFVEGTPNPLFNSLPNSPYLTNGQKLRYLGFIEGKSGISKFEYDVLFVVLHGNATVKGYIKLTARHSIFSNEIFCESGAIVLVFKPCYINENAALVCECSENIISNPYITKYRIWGKKFGENIFFNAWSGLNYTFHSFTQESKKNVARGAHAACFYQKNFVLHKGKVHMKTYFPNKATIVETVINKTNEYYEGYYIFGFCYHSFKALENSIDTIIVERNYGIPMKTYPLKTLFDGNVVCGERDGVEPTAEQMQEINRAVVIKV